MKLKPCPFCGSSLIIIQQSPDYADRMWYVCDECGCNTDRFYYSTEEAKIGWNTRPNAWVTITDDPASLPKESGWYLVLRDYKDDYFARKPEVVYYQSDHNRWATYPSIIAWQPIQPYEVSE